MDFNRPEVLAELRGMAEALLARTKELADNALPAAARRLSSASIRSRGWSTRQAPAISSRPASCSA